MLEFYAGIVGGELPVSPGGNIPFWEINILCVSKIQVPVSYVR